jgi:hypothetical protein
MFCEFCYIWVLPFELGEHAYRHLEEAASHVTNIGYTGVVGNGRQLVPRFCIFCYHNDDLDPCDRLNTFCAVTTGWSHHVNLHIERIHEVLPCPAFPSMCTKSTSMTCQEMRKHLACVHGVIIEGEKGKRGKKRTSSTSIDSE